MRQGLKAFSLTENEIGDILLKKSEYIPLQAVEAVLFASEKELSTFENAKYISLLLCLAGIGGKPFEVHTGWILITEKMRQILFELDFIEKTSLLSKGNINYLMNKNYDHFINPAVISTVAGHCRMN